MHFGNHFSTVECRKDCKCNYSLDQRALLVLLARERACIPDLCTNRLPYIREHWNGQVTGMFNWISRYTMVFGQVFSWYFFFQIQTWKTLSILGTIHTVLGRDVAFPSGVGLFVHTPTTPQGYMMHHIPQHLASLCYLCVPVPRAPPYCSCSSLLPFLSPYSSSLCSCLSFSDVSQL